MKRELTEIACIVDQSGSMASIRDSTIAGFNKFLEEQQSQPGDAILTLVLFSDKCVVVHDGCPLRDAAPLTPETYVPSGSTALFDAIGSTIQRISARMETAAEPAAKVIVPILTDGEENASRAFTRADVAALISRKRECGWEFVYLGANQDAFLVAESISIPQQDSMDFQSSESGIGEAFKQISDSTTNRRFRRFREN